MWDPDIKIPGIDGGVECNKSDNENEDENKDDKCSDDKKIGPGADDLSSDVILAQEGCYADTTEIIHDLEKIT